MSRYWKTILAALATLATWGLTASADGGYSQEEYWGLLAAVVGTLAVYAKANTPPAGQPSRADVSETDRAY